MIKRNQLYRLLTLIRRGAFALFSGPLFFVADVPCALRAWSPFCTFFVADIPCALRAWSPLVGGPQSRPLYQPIKRVVDLGRWHYTSDQKSHFQPPLVLGC